MLRGKRDNVSPTNWRGEGRCAVWTCFDFAKRNTAAWFRGMILASGARSPGFNSRSSPWTLQYVPGAHAWYDDLWRSDSCGWYVVMLRGKRDNVSPTNWRGEGRCAVWTCFNFAEKHGCLV